MHGCLKLIHSCFIQLVKLIQIIIETAGNDKRSDTFRKFFVSANWMTVNYDCCYCCCCRRCCCDRTEAECQVELTMQSG